MVIEFGPIAGLKLGFEFIWEIDLLVVELFFLRIAIFYNPEKLDE